MSLLMRVDSRNLKVRRVTLCRQYVRRRIKRLGQQENMVGGEGNRPAALLNKSQSKAPLETDRRVSLSAAFDPFSRRHQRMRALLKSHPSPLYGTAIAKRLRASRATLVISVRVVLPTTGIRPDTSASSTLPDVKGLKRNVSSPSFIFIGIIVFPDNIENLNKPNVIDYDNGYHNQSHLVTRVVTRQRESIVTL